MAKKSPEILLQSFNTVLSYFADDSGSIVEAVEVRWKMTYTGARKMAKRQAVLSHLVLDWLDRIPLLSTKAIVCKARS